MKYGNYHYEYNIVDKEYSKIYGAEKTYLKKYIDDLLTNDDIVKHFENLDSAYILDCAGDWLEDIISDYGLSPLLWDWAFDYWLKRLDNIGVNCPERKVHYPEGPSPLEQWMN